MTTFPTTTAPRLDVEIDAGTLRISTDDIDETTVDVWPQHDDDAGRQLAADTVVEQHGDDIVVRTPKRGRSWLGFSAALDVTIRAPHDARLRLSTGSADVTATGRFADTSVGTGSGDVTIGHVADSARLRTGSGDVRVDAVDGDLDVKTGSGDVHVARVGGAMSARSGSGTIELGEGGRALSATTGSGDVVVTSAPAEVGVKTGSGHVSMAAVRHGSVSVNAASGAIRAGIASGTAAWLDVRTVSGRVANDLDSTPDPTAGDARVRLRLHTVSGDITIARA